MIRPSILLRAPGTATLSTDTEVHQQQQLWRRVVFFMGEGVCMQVLLCLPMLSLVLLSYAGALLRSMAFPAALHSAVMDPAEHALHVGAADGRIFQVSLVGVSSSAIRPKEHKRLQQLLVSDKPQCNAAVLIMQQTSCIADCA